MILHKLTIAVILAVVAVACASASAPTSAPTPDAPQFADGEAVAVVKTWLSQITYDRVETRRSVTGGFGTFGGQDPVTGITTVTSNCLRLYVSRNFKWGSDYSGNGVWVVVAALSNENRGAWKVYERTVAVDTIQSAFPVC